jgi:hypothetical protein
VRPEVLRATWRKDIRGWLDLARIASGLVLMTVGATICIWWVSSRLAGEPERRDVHAPGTLPVNSSSILSGDRAPNGLPLLTVQGTQTLGDSVDVIDISAQPREPVRRYYDGCNWTTCEGDWCSTTLRGCIDVRGVWYEVSPDAWSTEPLRAEVTTP